MGDTFGALHLSEASTRLECGCEAHRAFRGGEEGEKTREGGEEKENRDRRQGLLPLLSDALETRGEKGRAEERGGEARSGEERGVVMEICHRPALELSPSPSHQSQGQ